MLPYKDVNDPRFSWLSDDFLNYLQMWHDSVAQRPGNYDENARARMFISRQTYEGMKISIYSLIKLVKFLLNSRVLIMS